MTTLLRDRFDGHRHSATTDHGHVLRVLDPHGAIDVGSVASLLALDEVSVRDLLDDLITAGLVERDRPIVSTAAR